MSIPELLISIDYGDDTPKEWKIISATLPRELHIIHDTAISRKLALNSIKELTDYLSNLHYSVENEIIEDLIRNGDEYVYDLCGGRTATIKEIIDAVANRNEAAIYFFHLENATDEELESWDASALQTLPRLRDIDDTYDSKSPFNEGWKLTIEYFDPNAEEL